jgi:hypothetical protein
MVAIGSGKGARRSEEMYKRTQASFQLVNKDRDRGLYALGMSKLKKRRDQMYGLARCNELPFVQLSGGWE